MKLTLGQKGTTSPQLSRVTVQKLSWSFKLLASLFTFGSFNLFILFKKNEQTNLKTIKNKKVNG